LGTTSIVAYEEHGQMNNVVWFAVYEGDRITRRINGAMVECVEYEDES